MSTPFRDPLLVARERIEALEMENEVLAARVSEATGDGDASAGDADARRAELEEQVRFLKVANTTLRRELDTARRVRAEKTAAARAGKDTAQVAPWFGPAVVAFVVLMMLLTHATR